MGAREDILTGKWQRDSDPKMQALLLGELIDRVEREHAQKLAEQQRAWARENHETLAGNAWHKVHDVIRYIDPEKS